MTALEPLRVALSQNLSELERAKLAVTDAHQKVDRIRASVRELQDALTRGRKLELAVTDHALLRYAERVLEFSRSDVVNLIREKVGPVALIVGDGKFPLCPGFHAVVKNRAVVTIEPAD